MSAVPAVPGRRRLVCAAAVLVLGAGTATVEAGAAVAAPAPAAGSASDEAFTAGRYVVTFADEPAASYDGGVPGYARTRPGAGSKLDPARPEVVRYRGRLAAVHDAALAGVGADKLYDYSVATNGVLTTLTADQARRLSRTPGVVRLERDVRHTLDTTLSPESLGLSQPDGLWSRAGGQADAGTGVIIGVIDSGIWPEAASFAGAELKRDKAGRPVETTGLRSRWSGSCVQGEQFDSQDCDDKLVGARYYVAGFGKQHVSREDYLSPRDGVGHGTHVASTAAGNPVTGVEIDGAQQGDGTASGIAPGADVAAYKVCWEGEPGVDAGCFTSDAVAAIDDAVADGVDVINYSVGSSAETGPLDAVQQAFRRAATAGVFVATSAGNRGPGPSTLDHPSPWLTTVAASTFRQAERAVRLGGDGGTFVGASLSTTDVPPTRLVRSVDVARAGADARGAALCLPGTLDPARTARTVVQCDRGVNPRNEKSIEVARAGGVGMLLTNVTPASLDADHHAVPTVHLDERARAAVLAHLGGATAPTAAIVAGSTGVQVPEIAAFSSRGPSTTTGGDVLKPDLAAPGVGVLAAVAPPSGHGRSYDYRSGTSMSSPHVAGIAALVRSLHPRWSPAAVKSALMTTAEDHASAASNHPFAQGAGLVVPNSAVDPGLVFDAGPDDWRSYLAGLGVRFAPPYDAVPAVGGSDLNAASLAIGALSGRQTVTRTVTNVGRQAETYAVREDVAGVDVVAEPATFTIAPGGTQTLRLTLTRTDARPGSWATGSLTLRSSEHTVRMPVAVRPVPTG